jgi:hypothetical protein
LVVVDGGREVLVVFNAGRRMLVVVDVDWGVVESYFWERTETFSSFHFGFVEF